jgi:hypothetical protein
LTEIRAFTSFVQCLMTGTMKARKEYKNEDVIFCFRCKIKNPNENVWCLDCKRAVYCSNKCKKRNLQLHTKICDNYIKNNPVIKGIFDEMIDNYDYYYAQIDRANIRKKK